MIAVSTNTLAVYSNLISPLADNRLQGINTLRSIKLESHRTSYTLTINLVVARQTDTFCSIPLRVRATACSYRNAAFSIKAPDIPFPAASFIRTLATIPWHARRADSTNSRKYLKKFILADTLESVEVTVSRANRRRRGADLAVSCYLIISVSSNAVTWNPIPVLMILTCDYFLAYSIHQGISWFANANFCQHLQNLVLLASRNHNLTADLFAVSYVPWEANTPLATKKLILFAFFHALEGLR